MQDPVMLGEGELSLVNALQIAPRASWSLLGGVLGTDPVTVARRWQRLTGTGRAWATAYGSPLLMRQTCLALVAVTCQAGSLVRIAEALRDDPHAVTVEHTTGGCDLLVTVWTTGLPDLSRYLVSRLGTLPGIAVTRTTVITNLYAEGSSWRLGVLDAAQQERLRRTVPAVSGAETTLRQEDRPLVVRLGRDARTPYAELAADSGISPATARRRVSRLLSGGLVALRCELARAESYWTVSATLWINVPPGELAGTAAALAARPETRLVAAVAGSTNLVITVWLRGLADLQRLEASLSARWPHLSVVDRAVVLRHYKLMGRVLDESGRALRAVDMDIWRDPAPGGAVHDRRVRE